MSVVNNQDIIFDATNVKFCVGPCVSKQPEAQTYQFKPYSGGKYSKCCYPLSNYSNLIITNFRICGSCNKRYLENWDEEDSEQLKQDGNTIRKKLNI